MLLALRITNFAVIESAEVEFGRGLTVLTGETGAGKSILVDALSLLLGGRADPELIRSGCEEASVEGILGKDPRLASTLEELGLPDLGEEVSVRRVIGLSGRAKAYVNGALVTVGVLGKVMRGTVDIAGQHEHVALFDSAKHRELLDASGPLGGALTAYRAAHALLQEAARQVEDLGGDENRVAERIALLREQVEEIDRLSPQPGEDRSLEEERRRLMSAERLRRAASEAEALLGAEEGSAADQLGRAANVLAEAAKLDGSLETTLAHALNARAEAEEGARALSRYLELLDGDPGRLQEVDDRLDAIRRLCKRHGGNVEMVLAHRQAVQEELVRLESRSELLAHAEVARQAAEKEARIAAAVLSARRIEAGRDLARAVVASLEELAMAKGRFEVQLTPLDVLGPHGADGVEFLFSANAGEPVRPLAKVASGGEASRLLLAVKRTLAGDDPCGTYVLDEADAGVSGAVAEVVGRMIRDVSRTRQVLCITHLPQVAAYADQHFRIEKTQGKGRTWSRVVPLGKGEERTCELARMLSGVELTREAMGAAEALVRSAQRNMLPRPRRAARPPTARKAG